VRIQLRAERRMVKSDGREGEEGRGEEEFEREGGFILLAICKAMNSVCQLNLQVDGFGLQLTE